MSVQARKIVMDTFDHWLDFEKDHVVEVLTKVRDMILYRLETETIEMDPSKLGVRDELEFTPDEIGPTFATEETTSEDITLGEEPLWEAPEEEIDNSELEELAEIIRQV